MLTGLQIKINALNAIIPNSFIFVLDSTDRSFLYKSSDNQSAINEIIELDSTSGIETLFHSSDCIDSNTRDHVYMIRKVGSHTFMGFFVSKGDFSKEQIGRAKDYFKSIQMPYEG